MCYLFLFFIVSLLLLNLETEEKRLNLYVSSPMLTPNYVLLVWYSPLMGLATLSDPCKTSSMLHILFLNNMVWHHYLSLLLPFYHLHQLQQCSRQVAGLTRSPVQSSMCQHHHYQSKLSWFKKKPITMMQIDLESHYFGQNIKHVAYPFLNDMVWHHYQLLAPLNHLHQL